MQSLTSQEEFNAFAQFRVRDNEHFVKVWPEIVATLEAPWATTNLGLFGHSIGGAAAAGAALLFDSETVASSLNIDGTYGDTAIDPATGDLKRPALSLGGSYRIDAPEETYDPTWDMFGALQTGWFRTLLVEGATHNDFDDYNFWKTLGIDGLGPIPSARAINVTREFITAFFNYTLLGQQEDILTVPGPEWPEVFVYDRSEDE